jgi:hypothetical protein
MKKYGYEQKIWEDGKKEIRSILIQVARSEDMISYSALCGKLKKIKIDYDSLALGPMLGEVSSEEYDRGHPLLSVIVIHKLGDQMPGPGFFELAGSLKMKVPDKVKFWSDEVKKVYKFWKSN